MNELIVGITKEIKVTVDEKMTALYMGSGTLNVLATPAVAALMEKAAWELLADHLEDGITTVGTMIHIDHVSATPVGAEIRVTAKLTGAEGRKYSFVLEAFDEAGLIAKGTHERFAVKTERFMEKTENKFR